VTLSNAEAIDQARQLMTYRDAERGRLERIQEYLYDGPDWRMTWLPASAPLEVQQIAQICRVNMLKFVVAARVQAMYVDGFRTPRSAVDAPAWEVWQRNKMDARQIGVHRAALAYGASYVTVLPGDPVPVLRGVSPRNMTVVYGDDDEWPRYALEKRRHGRWRLIDDQAVYDLVQTQEGFVSKGSQLHGAMMDGHPVCPVVRYRDTDDLDNPVCGLVEPLIALQDQINITSFGLLVAQHYGAFRQRYILGWTAESEEQKLKASASKVWVLDDPDIKIGEFQQTQLAGYVDSREASLRHLATISQTPAHELLGQLVNLSAEALAAAEAGHRRAVTENQTIIGEAHEQTLALAGQMMGIKVDPSASVRWRDTEARSLGMVVDALGKLVQMLGVPAQELWERVPGVTDDDIERWKAAAAEGDPLDNLTAMLERQSGARPAPTPQPVSEPAGAGSGANA
jgi:plastocyanin